MSLACLRTFSTTWEAGIAQSLLEGEGVRAIVEDQIINNVLPYMPSAIGGVRLMVEESDFDRAAQVLADWDASSPLEESELPDDSEQPGSSEQPEEGQRPGGPDPL